MTFTLDSRIERDSILIAELPLCQLRIQNDGRYYWLVLVPVINNVTEVHELSTKDSQQLIYESNAVAKVLKSVTQCKKINVANLGNICEQLHWHIVARFEDDEAWPGPIWGVGESVPWDEKKRRQFLASLLGKISETNPSLIVESALDHL